MNMRIKRLLVLGMLLAVAACSAVTRNPITAADLRDPQVPGIEGARYWADATPPNLNQVLEKIEQRRRASGLSTEATLTLSGGGENGAFAAGILTAWSEAGTRPEFTAVTGVSTGALAAPFAFLGSDYDDCPSSDNLEQQKRFPFGGSGSSLIEIMRFQFRGASAAWSWFFV